MVWYPKGISYGASESECYATLDGAYRASCELYRKHADVSDFVVELYRNESEGFNVRWVSTSFENEWRG